MPKPFVPYPAILIHSFALGMVAGMRSMTPLAALATAPLDPSAPTWVQRAPVRTVVTLLAAGELVADKMPFVPSRLQRGPLTGRLVLGSLAAFTLCRRHAMHPIAGSCAGAAGALLGSYAGYHGRRALGEASGAPDQLWALVEDTAAIALGRWAAQL